MMILKQCARFGPVEIAFVNVTGWLWTNTQRFTTLANKFKRDTKTKGQRKEVVVEVRMKVMNDLMSKSQGQEKKMAR